MDEKERLALIGHEEEKKKKEKKSKKRKSKEVDGEMIKSDDRKMAKLQKEIDEMRQTILKLARNESSASKPKMMKYAIGYSPEEYLSLGFIASANWISEKIAMNMRERMRMMEGRWDMFEKIKKADVRSIVTCVTYNRGESCRLGMWHTTLKKINYAEPEQSTSGRCPNVTREELRIHACTLCLKALGVLCMHSVMDCPWILEENWQ